MVPKKYDAFFSSKASKNEKLRLGYFNFKGASRSVDLPEHRCFHI